MHVLDNEIVLKNDTDDFTYLKAGQIYFLKAKEKVLLPPGRYVGNVLRGELELGFAVFPTGGIGITFMQSKIMQANKDAYFWFKAVPQQYEQCEIVDLPPPPPAMDDLTQMIEALLRSRGLIRDDDNDDDEEDDDDEYFDDDDLPLDASAFDEPEEELEDDDTEDTSAGALQTGKSKQPDEGGQQVGGTDGDQDGDESPRQTPIA